MAAVSDTNIKKLRSIANSLTKLLKKEIKEQKLIDTGRMIFETAVKLKINQRTGAFKISLLSTDYYKFLDQGTKTIKAHHITKKAFSGAPFQRLVKKLKNVMTSIMRDKLTALDK